MSALPVFMTYGNMSLESRRRPSLNATQWTKTHTHTRRAERSAASLPGCHAGTPHHPQTPKCLYGVVLKCPPSGGFQYDIGGPQVTSSSPFFSSFHVPLSLPQQFLNSPSFHISSSESLLTNPPHPLLHTSKPTAVFC